MTELHHEQCPWHAADIARVRSVCGCPEGWPKDAAPSSLAEILTDQLLRTLILEFSHEVGIGKYDRMRAPLLAAFQPLVDRLQREQAELQRFKVALLGHLCKHDAADWMACGQHSEVPGACFVCDGAGDNRPAIEPTHRHIAEKLQAAEAERDALRQTVQQG